MDERGKEERRRKRDEGRIGEGGGEEVVQYSLGIVCLSSMHTLYTPSNATPL